MSRWSIFSRGLCALGVISAVASTAQADRRTGLNGSLLIEDQDDVYLFPQLTSVYRNQISLDYGATYGEGNALLTLGNSDMAFGVAVHRGDLLGLYPGSLLSLEQGNLGGPTSPFAPLVPPMTLIEPATIVDLLLATGDLGFRLALGRSLTSTTIANGDSTGTNETFLMGEVGWGTGTRGQDTRIDLSGSLTLDLAGQETAGTDTGSGMHIGFGGLVRAYSPMDATMDLGFLGRLGVTSTSLTADAAPMEPTASVLDINAGGGIGPAFRFGNAQVAAYGVVNIGFNSNDPNSEADDDETGTLAFVIPGVHLAAEVPLSDWFVVRTGAEYGWNLINRSGPGPDDSGSADQGNPDNFNWNVGLGLVFDQFRFDGAVQQGFVTGGPDFIGGTGGGFLAVAALTYNFDAARSGEAPLEEAPAEEPAPEAEPAPAAPAFAPAPPPAAPENPEAGVGATGGASTTTQPNNAGVSAGGSVGGSIGTP